MRHIVTFLHIQTSIATIRYLTTIMFIGYCFLISSCDIGSTPVYNRTPLPIDCGQAITKGVKGDRVSVRVKPESNASIVIELPPETRVTHLCVDAVTIDGITWVDIQTGSGHQGWIERSLLEII